MQVWALTLAVTLLLPQAESIDATLRAAVERFYATQESEDVAGYLALWSSSADRPKPEQLKYIFDAGDDKFSDITITSVRPQGQQTVVRVTVNRERTVRRPDGSPLVFRTAMNLIGFRNRLVVLMQWAWAYFTYQRSIRLITTIDPRNERDA